MGKYTGDEDFIKNYKAPSWAQEVVDGMNKTQLERKKKREEEKIRKNSPPPRP